MMLDDTRGGLDASSLHRVVLMDMCLSKTVGLLSCHRNTSKMFELADMICLFIEKQIFKKCN